MGRDASPDVSERPQPRKWVRSTGHVALLLTGLLVPLALGVASCGPPEYGDTPFLCGAKGECPSGYVCIDKQCIRAGSQPTGPTTTNSSPDAAATPSTDVPGVPQNGGGISTGPGNVVDTGGSAGFTGGAAGFGGTPGVNGSGNQAGGPWGSHCFFPTDCPENQRCGFFSGRCCDPYANPNCI